MLRLQLRGFKLVMIISPTNGHIGYGTEFTNAHYTHHTKFKYNFGSNYFWDSVLGTYKHFTNEDAHVDAKGKTS